MSYEQSRPWYVLDGPCDEYKRTFGDGGGPQMIKVLKTIRAIIVNIGLVAIAMYALAEGGDATIIGPLGILTLAAYNGIEYADYAALAQAYSEYQDQQQD